MNDGEHGPAIRSSPAQIARWNPGAWAWTTAPMETWPAPSCAVAERWRDEMIARGHHANVCVTWSTAGTMYSVQVFIDQAT